MRRSSLNRFVPSRRRQIIRSFHFPLIVVNAVTRSEGSQSKRGLSTSLQNGESPGSQPPLRGCDQPILSLPHSFTCRVIRSLAADLAGLYQTQKEMFWWTIGACSVLNYHRQPTGALPRETSPTSKSLAICLSTDFGRLRMNSSSLTCVLDTATRWVCYLIVTIAWCSMLL